MKFRYLLAALAFAATFSTTAQAAEPVLVSSPDGAVQVAVTLAAGGVPTYAVRYGKTEVLRTSRLGLQLAAADLTRNLQLQQAGKVEAVADDYALATDKRSQCRYRANRRAIRFAPVKGLTLSVVFQVSNDGVAFQYLVEGKTTENQRVTAEKTTFYLPAGAKGWLHPHAVVGTGWAKTQPSYEEYYQMGIAAGTSSTLGQGWSFPALFEAAGHWVLLTEAGMGRSYCGAHLGHEAPDAEYSIALAQDRERTTPAAPVLPAGRLPWRTPWRVIVVGNSLAPIVESTLTTDLSAPAYVSKIPVGKPGKASWSWVLKGDPATVYDVQKQFIDYAAAMRWSYCLVDALWDKQIGYDKTAELARYAQSKNVGLLVWYNSNGSWNEAPQTPTNILLDPASRRQEFARIKKMGIQGVKIDFFGGDGQSFMNYYQDLLTDAAQVGLLVNFHGTTIPRGWNRTYPNLMTMEAVRGFEFLTFDQANTDQEPTHCAVLPFTRNAVGPMDFTPVAFSEITGKQRRTSNAFELALAVVFQSGIQHYAEVPEGMEKQPAYVVEFLRSLPGQWADVKFIAGYPGQHAVLARQTADGKWLVAGINGTGAPKTVQLDLAQLGATAGGTLITDGATPRSFATREVSGASVSVTLAPQGGFVLQLK
ncbi:glycoside hydrolase family 97 catalytic domain-containing protein [Hymenobacter sp. BT635]|uniref:Glycoside hydrolase family 97 catalytic domain-containing protein n=1 Tax=Hymenobacter nitidus TaxID=2880929 RepID=A0ABS8AJQ6_9BACT|nr:glycoside hydrolase family 97 protein [Hymenobacter nitidus]MCB2380506.1 glycoside hydrolase family 97 catalytic domain-containing protein [Hymenobacter nitidus]